MTLVFKNNIARQNGGDGLRIEKGAVSEIEVDGFVADNNGGHGINVVDPSNATPDAPKSQGRRRRFWSGFTLPTIVAITGGLLVLVIANLTGISD